MWCLCLKSVRWKDADYSLQIVLNDQNLTPKTTRSGTNFEASKACVASLILTSCSLNSQARQVAGTKFLVS